MANQYITIRERKIKESKRTFRKETSSFLLVKTSFIEFENKIIKETNKLYSSPEVMNQLKKKNDIISVDSKSILHPIINK